MKLILTLLTALASMAVTAPAHAQKNESFYALDDNWAGTDLEKARYLLRIQEMNDTCWQFDYYHIFGPLIRTEQYREKLSEVLHGTVRYYNPAGWLDSMGHYINGRKHGDFFKLSPVNDTMRYHFKYVYHNDQLMRTIDLRKLPEDTATNPNEVESEYPGGIGSWGKYLNRNLRYPDRALKSNIQGTVSVNFMVDTDGRVQDAYIYKSVEYSLDAETIRLIRKSVKWIPATRDGVSLKSYKIQPITYRFQ